MAKRNKNNTQAVVAPVTLIQTVENYISGIYEFRFNEVLNKVEYKLKGSSSFFSVSDYIVNSMSREMMRKGINCGTSLLWNILHSDFTPKYNPFTKYLNELPVWDQTTDYIEQLALTLKTNNDTMWLPCFKKWLVALVGSLLHDNVINHTVIVLSGKQGIGKTTWLLKLVPKELSNYKYSGLVNPNNKDTLITLSETVIINMDELETLNRAELNSVKELITKQSIRIRRAYGHTSENMPRRASFTGSVNGREFLSDTTGNRRFLCFEAKDIDYMHSVPIDMVYSQAKSLFESGYKYWFDGTEINAINNNNEQYRIVSIEEEILLLTFGPCTEQEATYVLPTTQIATLLKKTSTLNVTNASVNKLGKALTANGFLRLKKNNLWCWAIKQR